VLYDRQPVYRFDHAPNGALVKFDHDPC
jgi:hypothetical protein